MQLTLKEKVFNLIKEDQNRPFIKGNIKTVHGDIIKEVRRILKKIFFEEFKTECKNRLKTGDAAVTQYISDFQDQYASSQYKDLFEKFFYKDENDVDFKELLDKCIVSREVSLINLHLNKVLDNRTLDFFSTYVNFKGWNNFQDSPESETAIEYHRKSLEETEKAITPKIEEEKSFRKELNSVPPLEIENYIPRIHILEEIYHLFQQKNKKINITGISGVGKTFLAKHFIRHYYKNFSHIVWLNCSGGFVKAFSQRKGIDLLDMMGLASEYKSYTEGNMSEEGLMRMVLGRLKDIKGNNILILDNINEDVLYYEDEIYLSPNWKILTTSQEKIDGFCNYTIPYFNEKSIHLFYKYYTKETDDDNLIRLLSAIEYHTLAIELLAKIAQNLDIGIVKLVNKFIEKGVNVTEKAKVITDHNKERTIEIDNVEKYLNIIFDTSLLDEEEIKILYNISLMQSDGIDQSIFEEIYLETTIEGGQQAKELLNYHIQNLITKGWLQRESDSLKVHSLVKSIVIKRFEKESDLITSSVNNLIYKTNSSMTKSFGESLPYFILAETMMENLKTSSLPLLIELKQNLAILYMNLGLKQRAMDIYPRLNVLKEEINRDNKKDYYQLAKHLADIGNNNEALEIYQKCLDFFLSIATENYSHIQLAYSMFVHYSQDGKVSNLPEPQQYQIFISSIENITLISHVYNDMGWINTVLKNEAKAEEFHSNALYYRVHLYEGINTYLNNHHNDESLKKILSGVLMFLSASHNNIGALLRTQKKYKESEEHFLKCLEIRENVLSSDDERLSNILYNLSSLYLEIKNFEKAREYIARDMVCCVNYPKNNYRKKAAFLNWKEMTELAYAEKDPILMNQIALMEDSIAQELIIHFDTKEKDTDIIYYFSSIARSYLKHEFFEKASVYFEKALTLKKHYAEDKESFSIGNYYYDLALCNYYLNKLEKSLEYVNKVIPIYEQKSPNEKYLSDVQKLRANIINKMYYLGNPEYIYDEIQTELGLVIVTPNIDDMRALTKDLVMQSVSTLFKDEVKDEAISKIIQEFHKDYNGNSFIEEFKTELIKLLLEETNLVKPELLEYLPTDHNGFPEYNKLKEYIDIIISVYRKYKIWEKAIAYGLKKLLLQQQYIKNEHPLFIGITKFNLAEYYYHKKDFEEAEKYNNEAVKVYSYYAEGNEKNINLPMIKKWLQDALNNQKIIDREIKNYKS